MSWGNSCLVVELENSPKAILFGKSKKKKKAENKKTVGYLVLSEQDKAFSGNRP